MRFDFGLQSAGWAHPVIETGTERLQMRVSYLTDALGDLLGSIMTLVNGRGFDLFSWTEEPGGWRWILVRRTVTDVEVTIEYNPDVFTDPWRPGPPNDVRFHARIELVELVEAVASGSRRCIDEFGVDAFAARWSEHPFPRLQLKALEQWLLAGEQAPLYETR